MSQFNLQHLRLRDFRCFDSIDITFHPRLTVLVAANGAGKTSVLDAIAVALGPYVGAFDEAAGRYFLPTDIRRARIRATASSEMEYAPDGVSLEATGSIPGHTAPTTWKRSLAGPTRAKTTIKDAKTLIDYGKHLQQAVRTPGNDACLPVLAYYGTGRLWQQKKLIDARLERTSRTTAYANCLDPASSYKSFVAWFRYWSTNALKGQLDANKAGRPYTPTEFDHCLESVGDAVNTCLAPAGWGDIAYSLAREELVAHHTQHGELPVELLSDGIRNMVGMVADIAFRATKLNPQLGRDAARQTYGIVLIDEVDMHLHPAWQQIVLSSLGSAFPNLQFIVTTHSPQVLTSVDAACIRLLREDVDTETGQRHCIAATIPLQTRGVASSDLLARIMGVDPVPDLPEARMVADYHALIQQGLHASTEGIALRSAIDIHFGLDHPVLRECERMIRLQAFKQKLPIGKKTG